MLKMQTPVFRVSFPQMFVAKKINDEGKAKYGLTMLFTLAEINKDPKEKAKWDAMMAACKQVAAEKWPKKLPTTMMNPFRKGEEKEQYQGYGPGVIFISATTTTRPGLVDHALNKIIAPEDFYAGCYARATVNTYAWEFMGKTGVSFGLQNVQKVRDGEPFGGRTAAEDDFTVESSENAGQDFASTGDAATALFG